MWQSLVVGLKDRLTKKPAWETRIICITCHYSVKWSWGQGGKPCFIACYTGHSISSKHHESEASSLQSVCEWVWACTLESVPKLLIWWSLIFVYLSLFKLKTTGCNANVSRGGGAFLIVCRSMFALHRASCLRVGLALRFGVRRVNYTWEEIWCWCSACAIFVQAQVNEWRAQCYSIERVACSITFPLAMLVKFQKRDKLWYCTDLPPIERNPYIHKSLLQPTIERWNVIWS